MMLGSSVFTALLTHWLSIGREDEERKREVAYLALRLATKFETYAHDATLFVHRLASHTQPSKAPTNLPVLESMPGEQERWRDLDVRLTAEVLRFEGERLSKQEWIDEQRREDPEEMPLWASNVAISLGMAAFDLATRLRKRHSLPPFDTSAHWPVFLLDRYEGLHLQYKLPPRPADPPKLNWTQRLWHGLRRRLGYKDWAE